MSFADKYQKIGVFLSVRTGSTRLPNKALLKINGKATIWHLIKRIKAAKLIDTIVLCTTTKIADKRLKPIAEELGINFFAGNDVDLVQRHYDANKIYGLDFIINVDGDDIITDPALIDKVALEARKNEFDIVELEGYPEGLNPFGYKSWCLKEIIDSKFLYSNKENSWRYRFVNNPKFTRKVMGLNSFSENLNWSIGKIYNHLKENTKDLML